MMTKVDLGWMVPARPEEIAWAGGLFDGEGCISLRRRSASRRLYLSLILASTDVDPLERFQGIFGGKIRPMSKPKGNRRQAYHLSYTARADVERIMLHLYPWLSRRRRTKWDQSTHLIEQEERDWPFRGRKVRTTMTTNGPNGKVEQEVELERIA